MTIDGDSSAEAHYQWKKSNSVNIRKSVLLTSSQFKVGCAFHTTKVNVVIKPERSSLDEFECARADMRRGS